MDSSMESDNADVMKQGDLVELAYLYYIWRMLCKLKKTMRNKAKWFKLRAGEMYYKEMRKDAAGGRKVCLQHVVVLVVQC